MSWRLRAAASAAALVASSLVLGGCASDRATGPTIETADDRDASREQYRLALVHWRRSGPDAYTYTLRRNCFCIDVVRAPARVTVRDGVVVSAEGLDGSPVDGSNYLSVDQLFDLIASAFEDEAYEVRVSYDPELGYPRSVWIDASPQIADEEQGFEASDLVGHAQAH